MARYRNLLLVSVVAATSWGCSAAEVGGMEAVAFEGTCPANFTPRAGENTGFLSEGNLRNFHLLLPEDLSTPRPLFVALTGTVQPEPAFLEQSGLDGLTEQGWIVVAPVRRCAQAGTNCSFGPGDDGRAWEPWFDATVGRPTDDEGPDVRFVEEIVSCVAANYAVDSRRIYNGGISAGGTFPYRLLSFRSELFAGGVPASGTWYSGNSVPASPVTMDPSIVILIWGGATDIWPLQNPLVDYGPETKAASVWFAAQPNVVTVSCSGEHGHRWPPQMTDWLAETLLSHPKGTPTSSFVLRDPPEGFSCVLGPYTDH
jgi:poly(3-hydroxybutyrate) depolymerase